MNNKGTLRITPLDLEDLQRQMSKIHPDYKMFIAFKMTEKDKARFFGFAFKNLWMKIKFLIRLYQNKPLEKDVLYFSRLM